MLCEPKRRGTRRYMKDFGVCTLRLTSHRNLKSQETPQVRWVQTCLIEVDVKEATSRTAAMVVVLDFRCVWALDTGPDSLALLCALNNFIGPHNIGCMLQQCASKPRHAIDTLVLETDEGVRCLSVQSKHARTVTRQHDVFPS